MLAFSLPDLSEAEVQAHLAELAGPASEVQD